MTYRKKKKKRQNKLPVDNNQKSHSAAYQIDMQLENMWDILAKFKQSYQFEQSAQYQINRLVACINVQREKMDEMKQIEAENLKNRNNMRAMDNALQKKTETIINLEFDLKKLTDYLDTKCAEIKKLEAVINKEHNELSGFNHYLLSKDAMHETKDYNELLDEIKDLKMQLKSYQDKQGKIKDLKREHTEKWDAKVQAESAKISELKDKIQRMEEEFGQSDGLKAQINQKDLLISELKNQINEKEKQSTRQIQERDSIIEGLQEQMGIMDQIKEQIIKTKRISLNKDSLISDLRTQISQKKEDNAFEERESNILVNEQRIQSLEHELLEKSEQLVDVEIKMKKTEYYSQTKDAEIMRLEGIISTIKADRSSMNQQILNDSNGTSLRDKNIRNNMQSNNALMEQIKQRDDKILNLTKQMLDKNFEKQIKDLQNQIRASKEAEHNLAEKNIEYRSIIQNDEQRISILQKEFNAEKTEYNELNQKLKETQFENEQLLVQLAAQRDEDEDGMKSLMEHTSKCKDDISALRKSQQGHINAVLSLNDELVKNSFDEDKVEIINDLKSQMNKMHKNADVLKAKLKRYEIESAVLNKQIFKQCSDENTWQKLHKELDEKCAQCENLKNLVSEYKQNKKLNNIEKEEQWEENELLRVTLRSTCEKVAQLEAELNDLNGTETVFNRVTNKIETHPSPRGSRQISIDKLVQEKRVESCCIIFVTMIFASMLCMITNYFHFRCWPKDDIIIEGPAILPFDDEYKDFENVNLKATVQNEEAEIEELKVELVIEHDAYERRVHNLHKGLHNIHQEDLEKMQRIQQEKDKEIEKLQQIIADSETSEVALRDENIKQKSEKKEKMENVDGLWKRVENKLKAFHLFADGVKENKQQYSHERFARKQRQQKKKYFTGHKLKKEIIEQRRHFNWTNIFAAILGIYIGLNVYAIYVTGALWGYADPKSKHKHWTRRSDARLSSFWSTYTVARRKSMLLKEKILSYILEKK